MKAKIDELLFEYLPQELTSEKKSWRVGYLLSSMKAEVGTYSVDVEIDDGLLAFGAEEEYYTASPIPFSISLTAFLKSFRKAVCS